MTENYTGAEIENIVREAGMNAIRNKRAIVRKEDFEKALRSKASDTEGAHREDKEVQGGAGEHVQMILLI